MFNSQDPSPPPLLPPLPTSAFPTMMMMNSSTSRTATSSSSATGGTGVASQHGDPGNMEWPAGNNSGCSWQQTAAGNNSTGSGTYIPNWSDIFPPPPEGPPPPLDQPVDSPANTPRSARRRQQVRSSSNFLFSAAFILGASVQEGGEGKKPENMLTYFMDAPLVQMMIVTIDGIRPQRRWMEQL